MRLRLLFVVIGVAVPVLLACYLAGRSSTPRAAVHAATPVLWLQSAPSTLAQEERAVDDSEEATVLSFGDSYDDFASVAQAADGSVYAAYAAYFDGHDQIRLHKLLPTGNWSMRTHVPLARAEADVWMPQLAVDKHDTVWVLWCEQTELTKTRSGNWDIFARALYNDTWGPLVRLTDDPKPDINPHVTSDRDGNLHLVWQAHPDNFGSIRYRRYDGEAWSDTVDVTSAGTSDWYPQVAVAADGAAWIAFDSYRRGDYDVFLTSVREGTVGELVPVATTRYYETHASVACAPDGRVWVAWEQGGWNWGKDQGYWLRRQGRDQGSTLGASRAVQVACFDEGRLLAGPSIEPLVGDVRPGHTASATLAADTKGRLWLRYRQARRGRLRGRNRFTRYWDENVTFLTAGGWSPATSLPASTGRTSVFSRLAPASDGGLWVAYSSDRRGPANYHQPIHEQALIQRLEPPAEPAGSPTLADYQPPAPPENAPAWDDSKEAREVEAIRQHRAQLQQGQRQIVRGDLHRHTELSWDVGPGNDGSYLDFYRYMIDVAQMDFGSLTDHQGGGHYPYHWWLTEKSADMYYLAPRFVPLYGYERSLRFPNGHRNVFHSYRGVPVFPFQVQPTQAGVFPGVATNNVVENDTKLLYEYLRKTEGLAISHTSGTPSMGTDWRDNDPLVEPVVEIYQGARNSYEVVGGPRVHDIAQEAPERAPGGFQEAGMVWNALAKGYRLGTTSSSDHGSTHISYSMVYTAAVDRESILEAIRQRHTYGATDNIIVEFWADDQFMGDEFESSETPELRIRVHGTDTFARLDLIRNNQYIYNTTPDTAAVDLRYSDREAEKGLNYYYFRAQQDDGQVVWSSPIWVHRP